MGDTSDKMETQVPQESRIQDQYRTIARRILADLIDSSVFYIFGIFILLFLLPIRSDYSYIILFSISLPAQLAYRVIMTKLYGGTLGKLFFNLKVVTNDSETSISWKQSFLREIINMGSDILFLFSLYYFVSISKGFIYIYYLEYSANNLIAKIINYQVWFVFIIEIITSLFSIKRRAVHDFIAGTVVKKTGTYKSFTPVIAIIGTIIIFFVYFKIFSMVIQIQ